VTADLRNSSLSGSGINLGVSSVTLLTDFELDVLEDQTEDGENTEGDSNAHESEEGLSIGEIFHSELLEDVVRIRKLSEFERVILGVERELSMHDSGETVADRGDNLHPRENRLGHLSFNRVKVNHVTTEQVQRQVENGGEGDGCGLVVENGGEEETHGSSGLHHEDHDEVHGEELSEAVGETNAEVHDRVENEGHDERNRDFCNPLRGRVDPNVVHATGTLTHVHGLLSLEHDDGGLEVQRHLLKTHEVDGSDHGKEVLHSVVFVELPEDGEHESADNDILEKLGTSKLGLTSGKDHGAVKQLSRLLRDSCLILDGGVLPTSGGIDLDELVFS